MGGGRDVTVVGRWLLGARHEPTATDGKRKNTSANYSASMSLTWLHQASRARVLAVVPDVDFHPGRVLGSGVGRRAAV